jgi:hypothetical protein
MFRSYELDCHVRSSELAKNIAFRVSPGKLIVATQLMLSRLVPSRNAGFTSKLRLKTTIVLQPFSEREQNPVSSLLRSCAGVRISPNAIFNFGEGPESVGPGDLIFHVFDAPDSECVKFSVSDLETTSPEPLT